MGRNGLYLIVGGLVIAVAVLGFILYDEKQNEPGIDVQIGEDGLSVETN
jgi:hypothetical protein